MSSVYLRIGALAEVHAARASTTLRRGRRVIARTPRGVELGEVIGPCRDVRAAKTSAFRVLRATTEQDELLIRRLGRHKREAVEACRAALNQSGSTTCLLDVDQIFDGNTLVMHFLGPVDEIAQRVTKQVAQEYETIVRSRHFAKLLRDGCGPDCGTSEGGGCGGSCAGCAVTAACGKNG